MKRGFFKAHPSIITPMGKFGSAWFTNKNLICGTFEIFLENGELFQTMEYMNGKPHGKAYKYWLGGKIAAEETYHHGLLTCGNYFQLNGQLISQIIEGKGYRAIFGKTNVCELQEFNQGVLEGEVKTFSEEGNLLRICRMKNNLKYGEELEYFPPNPFNTKMRPMLSMTWLEGKIHGPVKTWYENGILESQREMANNIKSGLSTAWYRDGSLMMIEEYDQDKWLRVSTLRKVKNIPLVKLQRAKGWQHFMMEKGIFYTGSITTKGYLTTYEHLRVDCG